jgi:hypothetical protein
MLIFHYKNIKLVFLAYCAEVAKIFFIILSHDIEKKEKIGIACDYLC